MRKGVVISIIIVLFILLIGGYYFYKNYFAPYQTYKNNQYGFEFIYPNGWYLTDKDIWQSGNSIIVKVIYTEGQYMSAAPQSIFLVRLTNENDSQKLKTGEIKLDSGWTAGVESTIERIYYMPEKNINIYMSARDIRMREIEEQMLSTFKFEA